MISIVAGNREVLADSNGNSSWSGATLQAYNTNATSWALASYLYKYGAQYWAVPLGLVIGAAAVIVHRIFYQVGTHLICRVLWTANRHLRLSQRLGASIFLRSTCLSSFSMLVISRTTRVRLVWSSVGSSLDSMFSTTCATIVLASSRIIHTWWRVLSMEPVWRFSLFSLLLSSALVELHIRSRRGGAIMQMATMTGVLQLKLQMYIPGRRWGMEGKSSFPQVGKTVKFFDLVFWIFPHHSSIYLITT